jgi:fatty-acid desaturase
VYGLHVTWLINSATHIFGRRRFQTTDDSRNSFILAVLTFGEGWHNNHHAHQTSARHGLAWYEFDISWITLKLMKLTGLVWGVRTARLDAQVLEQKAA